MSGKHSTNLKERINRVPRDNSENSAGDEQRRQGFT